MVPSGEKLGTISTPTPEVSRRDLRLLIGTRRETLSCLQGSVAITRQQQKLCTKVFDDGYIKVPVVIEVADRKGSWVRGKI